MMDDALELQNLKLKIMAEVNERIDVVNDKFDELIGQKDQGGSEFARNLKTEIDTMRKSLTAEIKNVWSYFKSKLVSIEHGQKILYDQKDGILPNVLKKADAAVKSTHEAAECTAQARKSANEARLYIRANIFVTSISFLGILITVIGGYFMFMDKSIKGHENEQTMITALNAKLEQDEKNQKETVEYMKHLHEALNKLGR